MPDPTVPVVDPNLSADDEQVLQRRRKDREQQLRANVWGAGDTGVAARAKAVGDVSAQLKLPPAVVDLNLEAMAGRAKFQAIPFEQLSKENPRLAQAYLDRRWAAQLRESGPGLAQTHKIIDDSITDIMRRNEPEIDQRQEIGSLIGLGAGARSAVNRLGQMGWAIPAIVQRDLTNAFGGDETKAPTWSPLGQFWNLRRMQDAEDWNRRQMRQGFVSALTEAGGQLAADPTATILPLSAGMSAANVAGRTMQVAGRTTFEGGAAGFAPAAVRVEGQLVGAADAAKNSLNAAAIVGGQFAAVQGAMQSVEARRARGEDTRLMSWGELANTGAQAAIGHLSTVYGGLLAEMRLLDQTRKITSSNLATDLAGAMSSNAAGSVAGETAQSITDTGEFLSGQDLAVSGVSSAGFAGAMSIGTLATAGEHNARLRYIQATDVVRSLGQISAMKAAADHAIAMGQSRADVRTLMQSGLPANLARVHIAPDALQALATARSVTMDELIADLGLDPKAVADAQALGHEVPVPTHALVDGISSAELQTLGDRIRFNNNGATLAEVRDEVTAIQAVRRRAQAEAEANTLLAEAADDEATKQLVAEAAGSVSGPAGDEATAKGAYRAQWVEQLVAAGESQAAAEAAADLWVNRQDARAKRLSLPFDQVAQFNPITVTRQGAAILDHPLNTVGRALAVERGRRAAEVRQREEARIAAIKSRDEAAAAAEQERNARLQGKEGDDLIADARTRLAKASAGSPAPLAQGSSEALRALGEDFGIAPDASAAQAIRPEAKQRLDDLKHALNLRGQTFKTLFADAFNDSRSMADGQAPMAWMNRRLSAPDQGRPAAASEAVANATRELIDVSRALNDPRAMSAMPEETRAEYEAKARQLAEQIMPELDKQLSDMAPEDATELVRAMHDAGQDVGARALAQGPEQVDARDVGGEYTYGTASNISADAGQVRPDRVEARRRGPFDPNQQTIFDITDDGKAERDLARGDTSPQDDDALALILSGVSPDNKPLQAGAPISRLIKGYVDGDLTAIAPLAGAKVETARDAASLLAAYRSPFVERTTWMLVRNDEVVHNGLWAIGGIDYAAVPDTQQINGLLDSIDARPGDHMIWSHNHPSGKVDPSAADRAVYSRIQNELFKRDISFDGLVLNGDKFTHNVGSSTEGEKTLTYDGGKSYFRAQEGAKLAGPEAVASFVKGLVVAPGGTLVIHVSPNLNVVGVEAFHAQPSIAEVKRSRDAAAGAHSFIVGAGILPNEYHKKDSRIADVISIDDKGMRSYRRDGVYAPGYSSDQDTILNKVRQTAYHGTGNAQPYDRFRYDRVGGAGGEGAQAYGWGLYFAGKKEVAEHYRTGLSAAYYGRTIDGIAQNRLNAYHGDKQEAIKALREQAAERPGRSADLLAAADLLESGKEPAQTIPGRLYTVDIPEDSEMLDWDAPLKDQPEHVKKAIDVLFKKNRDERFLDAVKAYDAGDTKAMKAAGFNIFDYPGSTGALYKRASEITAEDRRMDEQRSQKAVSDFLRANGVPGIRYLDQMSRGADGGSRNYVIFDDSRIAIQAYEQPGAAPIGEPWRGRIIHDPRTRSARIELAAKRDASTFAHESFHHWLFEMLLDADRPEATQQMRDDARLTLRKLGVTDQQMEGKTFTDLLDGLTVDQHEKWAGWGETYLRTAKSPSKDLATTFSRFRSWIGRVWRGLMAKGTKPEDIDAEVSGIMDRLLATDDAIQAANANDEAMRLQALVDSPIRKLLAENPEQAALAAHLADDAKREQSDAMAERAAAESRREQTESWRADMQQEREAVTAEVDAQPVYQAIAKIAAKDLPADQRAMRLEPGAVRALLNEAHQFADKKLLNNAMTSLRGKLVLAPNGGGVHPDAIAEAMGYASGIEMVLAIVGARPRQQLIDAVAAERMRQKHGDLKTDPALAEEAGRRAINNSRARLIQLEMSALTRKSRQPGAPVPTVEVVRRYARDQIAGRAVYSIEPALYRRAMDKAAREAFLAAGEGRWDDARAAKHRELVNHELLRAAEQAVEASKKGRDYLAKFENNSVRERIIKAGGGSWSVTWTEGGAQQTKVVGTVEEARQIAAMSGDPNAAFAEVGGYMEQIEGVLDGFSLRRASKKRLALRDQLRRFVEYRQELGDPIDIPEGVVADLGSKRWDELTPLQQKDAVEAIEQIDNLARINGKLLAAHRQASYEDAKAELLASIEANAPRNADQSRTANTPGEKMGAMMGDFMGAHVKDSFLARELDGYQDGGAAWDLLIRPRNDAANREAVMIAAVAKERAEQMAAWGKKATAVIDPDLKLRGKALTNEERIAVALNYGNAEGRQRLLYLADNDQEMLDRIIKSLDAADRALVEATWRLVDRHWSEIQALEKRTRGVQPIKVDAVPYQVGNVTMTGGYYPISYGSDNAPARGLGAFDEATGKLQGVATGRATTRAGSVQTRAKTVNKDIKLDFGVVAEHLRETIHDITHREVVRDQVKILNDPEIQQAIRQKLGIRGLKQLADTVRYMAQGDKQDNDGLSKTVRFLRRNGTGATFAFNLSSALLNITGFANSLTRLGPVEMAVGAKHFVGIEGQERSLAGIHRRSEFMRTRHQTWMREVAEAHRMGATGLRDRMWLIGYWPMAKVQQLVDGITWAAAYEKALRGGAAESDAVAVADQTVRDTQGSGQIQDLAGVQRGGELKKAFTTFYSYFGATYQLQREGVLRAAYRGRGDDWMALGSATLLATFVPAMVGALLGQALRGDDVLDDPEKLAKKLALEQIGYTAGYLVLVRDIVGPAVSGFGWEGPAGTRGVGALGDAIDGIFKGDLKTGDIKKAITAAGFLSGLPATEINRAVDAWVIAGERGEYAGAARILLFGKPRADR